jgi:hypothetical protein
MRLAGHIGLISYTFFQILLFYCQHLCTAARLIIIVGHKARVCAPPLEV